jgi:hypothetical protein
MLQQTKLAILKTLKTKPQMSEIDIANTMKTNFTFIEPSISELEADGEIVVIGKKYVESLGKIFRVVTIEKEKAFKMASQLEKRQYNSQKKAMCVKLLSDLDEFKNKAFIIESLSLLKRSPQKISKEYFHLNNEDIISIYQNVLENGHAALAEYEPKTKTAK